MFIPLADDNSRRTITPAVTWTLIALNILVWLLQLQIGPRFSYGYAMVPAEITGGTDIVGTARISVGDEVVGVPHFPGPVPIYLTLITSMFMHGSWMHIIGNMLYLFIFGDQIEDLLGHFRFIVFYLVCGLTAGIAHIAVGPDSVVPSLGASGAIAGVLGGYLLRFPTNLVHVLFIRIIIEVPAFIVLGGWILLQLISQVSLVQGQGGGVAYMAHIGGFVAGLALVNLFAIGSPRD